MKPLLLTVLIALSSITVLADIRLPDVIGNSMVLQQKQTVPIWGSADPGETVIVTFAGQKKTTVAGPDGKWRADLGKLSANATPQVMTIAGKTTVELKDILIG